MGGFLSGLGTILGGWNTARRIDEEGFDFRETAEQEEWKRQREQELARQRDEDRNVGIGVDIALGTPEGEEPDFGGLFGQDVDEARAMARVRGKARGTKVGLAGQEAYYKGILEDQKQAGRIELQDVRAEDRQDFLELNYKLERKQPLTASERRRYEEIQRRTEMMRDRPVGGLGGGGVGLTSEGLEAAARQYAVTGQMPSLGMGAAGTRQAIINEAARLFPGVDIAGNAARYRAGTGALTNVTKVESAVTAFEDAAKRNAGLLRGFLREIPDLGVRPLNQAARAIATTFGDTSMAEFNVALQSVRNEYARIISNPNLVGVMSDTARREGEVLLNPNATVDQILAALDVLETEARNRRESFGAVKTDLLGSFGGDETAPVGASGSGTAEDPFVF
jgi:hypothetical protein